MALTGGHKCVAPPFQVGDAIEGKEVIHRAFGPNVTRWVPFRVEGIRGDNKMLLSTTDPSYMPSVCVPYREGWFRKREVASGDPHQV